MSNQSSTQLAPAALSISRPAAWLRSAGVVLAGSAFVAACAHVALPLFFTPVPLTLQPFAVLLLGLLLAPQLAGATMTAYLLEGAVGLPVFTPGPVGALGIAHLLGPTGGYLLTYPAAAMLIAYVWRRGRRNFAMGLLATAIGNLLILTGGALWLGALTHAPAPVALAQGVVPFIPGDALKIAAAAALATGWQRLRGRYSPSHSTM